jgi:hypothetical protein
VIGAGNWGITIVRQFNRKMVKADQMVITRINLLDVIETMDKTRGAK